MPLPLTLLTAVHWGKPLHTHLSLSLNVADFRTLGETSTSIALNSADFRTSGETSSHPPVSLPYLC